MGKESDGHGYITVSLTPEGIEAIAEAVVRKLREGGAKGLNPERHLPTEDKVAQPREPGGGDKYRAYFTESEAAAYLAELGVMHSVGVLRKERVTGGGIPFVKLGNRVRYRKEDIDTWLSAAPSRASTSDTGIPQKGNRPR